MNDQDYQNLLIDTTTARTKAGADWRHAITIAATAQMTQKSIGHYAGVSQQRIAQILSNNDDGSTA